MGLRHYLMPIAALLLIGAEPCLAGPGGLIAKAAIGTFWGRALFGLLALLILPLLIALAIQERRAEKRTLADLAFMQRHHPTFDWPRLRERAQDCFFRIHAGWRLEDLSTAADWMTDWFWQNQQQAVLERWRREGLVNHCRVERLEGIRPLLFLHRNEGGPHQGSLLVLSITARMQDYLARRDSGERVEGCRRLKSVETVWSFRLEADRWRVANIEAGCAAIDYLRLGNALPAIEETLAGHLRA